MSQQPTPKQGVTYIRNVTPTSKPTTKERFTQRARNAGEFFIFLVLAWLIFLGIYALIYGV